MAWTNYSNSRSHFQSTNHNDPSINPNDLHCTRNIALWDKESQLRNNTYLDSIQKSIGTILTKKSSRTMQKCASPSLLHLHNFIKPDGIDVQRVHLDISSIRGPVSRSRALPRTCPARPRGGTDRVPRERCLEGGGGGARRERWSVARSPARLLLSWPS